MILWSVLLGSLVHFMTTNVKPTPLKVVFLFWVMVLGTVEFIFEVATIVALLKP